MTTFLEFLFGPLLAWLIWDAVKYFAKKSGELPLVWFLKTALILFFLCAVVAALGTFVLYALKGSL